MTTPFQVYDTTMRDGHQSLLAPGGSIAIEDCYFRMMRSYEIGRGCAFDVDFHDYKGTFKVWGQERQQVDGFGNAVSPPVGEWLGGRIYAALQNGQVAA